MKPRKSAIISECGDYRYVLERRLRNAISPRPCMFIMLNPSTADDKEDDATITKCMKYAYGWGYDELVVCNLFAYRATDFNDLLKFKGDPIGVDNKNHLECMAIKVCHQYVINKNKNGIVICGWGNNGYYMEQGIAVLGWLEDISVHPYYLRMNNSGHPNHPLYLKDNLDPIQYNPWPQFIDLEEF